MAAGLRNVYIFSNEQISPGITGIPVGTITAWLKSYTNVPALPNWFVECNGQVLNDPLSPFNGQTIPNLNDSGSTGRTKTLRGNQTSGDPARYFLTAATPGGDNMYDVVWIMRVR